MVSFLLGTRFLIIPIWLILLLIIFPFFPDLNLKIVKNIELYIEGNQNIVINKFILYLYLIILSPLFLRLRFQKIRNILKYAISICFLYPLVLPFHFMTEFEGIIGYSFFIFFVVGNKKVIYESWALQFTFIYYATIILSWIFFSTGKKYYEKKNYVFIITNILICITLFVIGMIINFITLAQSLTFALLFFTTGFILVLIVLFILFLKYFKLE